MYIKMNHSKAKTPSGISRKSTKTSLKSGGSNGKYKMGTPKFHERNQHK